MSTKYNIAILGATGIVGRTVISILQNRNFPINKLYLLATSRSLGRTLSFNEKQIEVQDAFKFDFSKVKIAFFCAGSAASKLYAKKAANCGCVVIDNTSLFRYENDVPLVVPEVNPQDIQNYHKQNIISNPNCSTIQMLVALKPIYDAVGIDRINVCTYQSVSGSGNLAVSELTEQTGYTLGHSTKNLSEYALKYSSENFSSHSFNISHKNLAIQPKVYPKQIAFNVFPHIDEFMDNGYTKEEMKMVWETKKILHDDNIKVNATTVRVPVYYGHSEAVNIETKKFIDEKQVRKLCKDAKGVKLIDNINDNEYPTPLEHGSGTDLVYVGRVRKDISHPLGVNMWIVADNVRKGAALNSVQIAESLINII